VDKVDNISEQGELEVQPLPTGDDPLSKAMRIRDILKNKFLNVTIEDGLVNLDSLKKLSDDLDRAGDAVSKLESKFFDDEELSDKLSSIGHDLNQMWGCLYDLIKVFEDKTHLKQNLNLK